jgi:hypothetical protein
MSKLKQLEDFPCFCNPKENGILQAIAMCLYWHGITGLRSDELIHDLFTSAQSIGHEFASLHTLRWLVHLYYSSGIRCDFEKDGTFADIKDGINRNNPIIIAGLFSRLGDVAVCTGYDDDGLVLQIPHKKDGKDIHLKYKELGAILSPESSRYPSDIWMFEVSKVRKR